MDPRLDDDRVSYLADVVALCIMCAFGIPIVVCLAMVAGCVG
jgi:hypothetical protein